VAQCVQLAEQRDVRGRREVGVRLNVARALRHAAEEQPLVVGRHVREQQPAAANPLAARQAEDHVMTICDRANERRERLEALGERIALCSQGTVLKLNLRGQPYY